jgi:calcium-dependent protein kinase
MFDSDGNGRISASELKKVLASGLASEEKVWSSIIEEVDNNGDGEIDFGEFESIIMNKLN